MTFHFFQETQQINTVPFFDICFLSIQFSLLNLAIFWSFCFVCYLRAKYEEKLLLKDSIYLEYYQKTDYMFIPMIFW